MPSGSPPPKPVSPAAPAGGRPGLHGARLLFALAAAVLLGTAFVSLTAADALDAAHRSIRFTARCSVTLFCAAFAASSLRRLWPVPWTGYVRRNRRALGLGFAFAHFMHLGAIGALGLLAPHDLDSRLNPTVLIGGGLAYLFIAAMALSSTDRAQAYRGGKPFRLLHTAGSYYLWLIFANSYLPRAAETPAYLPAAALLLLALGLRLAARLKPSPPR